MEWWRRILRLRAATPATDFSDCAKPKIENRTPDHTLLVKLRTLREDA